MLYFWLDATKSLSLSIVGFEVGLTVFQQQNQKDIIKYGTRTQPSVGNVCGGLIGLLTFILL